MRSETRRRRRGAYGRHVVLLDELDVEEARGETPERRGRRVRVREVAVGQRAARARAGRQLVELLGQLFQHQSLALPARLVDLVLRDACRHKARTRVPSD